MGIIIALDTAHCRVHRLEKLIEIKDLLTRAEHLFGSIRFWMTYEERYGLVSLANDLVDEANRQREIYNRSFGIPQPATPIRPWNYRSR